MASEGAFGSHGGQVVDLSQRRDLGEIAQIAWSTYRGHVALMVAIAALQVPLQVVSMWGGSSGPASSPITGAALQFVLGQLIVGALIYAGHEAFSGGQPSIQSSLEAARARMGALLTTGLLGGVLTVASLVAFPYFAVRWALSNQAVVLEDRRNWAALDASAALVRGSWWRAFGILLLVNVVFILSMPAGVAASLGGVNAAAVTLLDSVVLAAVQPFTVLAGTLLYFDLKARHAATDAQSSSVNAE